MDDSPGLKIPGAFFVNGKIEVDLEGR